MSWAKGSVALVWVLAAVGGALVVAMLPGPFRGAVLALVLAGCVLVAFALQFTMATPEGALVRIAASVTGALLVLAAAAGIGLILGSAGVVSG